MSSRATPVDRSNTHIPDTVRVCKGTTEPIAISMRPGPDHNQKIIFWFLAVADGTHAHDTQMENEDFRVHFYTFEQALARLTFETDRSLVKTAIIMQ